MARLSSPWRALRPVLLAGAAAVSWLTLSSAAASADTAPDSSSLLGGVTTSVSSLTHDLAGATAPAPAASPGVPAEGPGLLQPVVSQVSGLTDNLIASVPVVDQLVPAGTVSTVSAPLVEVADGVTAGVVQVVLDPVTEAAPVLEPVLEPVSDLLTGTAPLPVAIPGQPVEEVQGELPAAETAVPAEAQPAPVEASGTVLQTATEPEQPAAPAGMLIADGSANQEAPPTAYLAGTSVLRADPSGVTDPLAGQPLPIDPAPLPAQAPAAPGSGTGSSGSSGGSSGAAAWLSPFGFDFERPGTVLAADAPEHAPAPVSFDPGSSPD
jgi:hypothetical protein